MSAWLSTYAAQIREEALLVIAQVYWMSPSVPELLKRILMQRMMWMCLTAVAPAGASQVLVMLLHL